MIEHITRDQYHRLTKKGNKYKNKIVKNALGQIENHSRGENKFAKDLFLELKAGKYKHVVEQARFTLTVNGEKICVYIVDFLITHHDDSHQVIEYKGKITSDWRIKWKLLKALYPEYKYTLIRHE